MAASVRAVSQSSIATGNITITKPTGTADGDVLIAIGWADPDGAQLTAPGGWTSAGTSTSAAGFIQVWRKVAASEGANYTFTGSGASDNGVIMFAIQGADTTNIFDGGPTFSNNGGTSTTSHSAPSVSPGNTDSLLLCGHWIISGATNTWTPPAGMSENADGTSGWATFEGSSLALSSSGATGTKTATSSVASFTTYGNLCVSMAIRSANANATVTPTAIAHTVTVPTPTVIVTALPAPIARTVVMPAPTILANQNATVTPAVIARSVVMPAPNIFIPDARVLASTISRSFVVPTPTVTASANVAVAAIARQVVVPLPNILLYEFGPIPFYRIQSRLRDGTFVCELPAKNLQFELGWNKPYGMRFEVPVDHPLVTEANLEAGLHEIWIWRNGVVVAAGPLWDIVASSDSRILSCGAMNLLDYFDVRLIDNTEYVTTEQTSIAWGLIAQTQAHTGGALNIVQGSLSTGITRSAKWIDYDNKYVLEAIQDMSEMDQGFDFYIDPQTRAFTAQYPRPQRNVGLQLVYPYHIRRYSVQYMGKWMRNRIRITGEDPNYATAIDTASRTKYGLRDLGDSYRDAATVTDLTAYTSKLRDRRSEVRKYPTCVLAVQHIDIFNSSVIKYGDIVRVIINDGYVNYNQDMRYITAQVTVDKQGLESVVIYLQDPRELE